MLPDQLSEISQQIQIIQGAIKGREPQCEVNGTSTSVDSNAGIFVTLNPAGKGYGGRSKLPDNLKVLVRTHRRRPTPAHPPAHAHAHTRAYAHAHATAIRAN